MIVQDKKLISGVRVKLINFGENFEKRINDFIKDKNVYDIQYVADSDDGYILNSVMIVYQVVGSVKTNE